MSSASDSFDLVIIGGGPAGCAAAIAARRRKLRTLVIQRSEHPASPGCAGWVGPAAGRWCRECGLDLAATGVAFAGLRLWPWDFSKCVELRDRGLAGHIVDPGTLGQALLTRARASGAEILQPATVTQLSAGESCAAVHLSDGSMLTGRLAVIADGATSTVKGMAQLADAPPQGAGAPGAVAVFDTPRGGSGLDVIIGATHGHRVATIARGAKLIRVGLLTRDSSAPVREQMAAVLTAARSAGLLPGDRPPLIHEVQCPAGAALEFESHVGKRCVLVGDAGGFGSAFSNESLYPALRSGWLAAETAAAALKAAVPQDELALFSSRWRAELADYLRTPTTDLSLLLPMVFNNTAMSRRFGRAFLLGEAF